MVPPRDVASDERVALTVAAGSGRHLPAHTERNDLLLRSLERIAHADCTTVLALHNDPARPLPQKARLARGG
ncbi:hypothetical protein [Streptomyces sp. NPDC001450]